MSLRKRLLVKPPDTALVPSEHFGVVLYEGDGSTSHSINGGKFGAGAYIDSGTGSYINLGAGSSFASGLFNGKSTFSVSIWFRKSSSSLGYIFNDYANNSLNVNISILADGRMEIFTRYSSGDTSYNSTTTYDDDNWHHVVVTLDQTTGVRKSYIDGTLVDTQTTSSNSWNGDSDQRITIGALYYTPGDYYQSSFDGKIDQLRVFTKALTSSEVSTLYAETASTAESLDPLSEDTTDTLQVLGDSSCIATYQFENDETDLSGNYDGTGTSIQYAAGRYGQAASFNGSSSGIDLPNLGISGSQSRTVSFWFNLNTTPSGTEQLYSQGTNNLKEAFNIQLTSSAKVQVSYAGREWDSTTALSTGQWYHILVTYNGGNIETSSNTEIYINGTEETLVSGGGSSTGSASTSNTSYSLGYRTNISTLYVDGKIDQVRVFNKALSASEVTTLYEENSLVASYRFEGNANDDMRAYDGTASNVTYEYGLNFTPDFVWTKRRDLAADHNLVDSTRGIGPNGTLYAISPNLNGAQTDSANNVKSLDSGGFTVGGTGTRTNADGYDYVSWCLKANGGTTSSNTDGSITSTVQANTDAGFSIVKYTGTGTSGATVGHGLSAKPELIITKNLIDSVDWNVKEFSTMTDDKDRLELNESFAIFTASSGTFILSTTNSTTIGLGSSSRTNGSGDEMIAYCFHSVDGFSKIGSYTGNGSANGPIIETGFEPAFIMVKRTSNASDWSIFDNKRNLTNPRDLVLAPNLTDAERTYGPVTFLSNGFQQTNTNGGLNSNGDTFIYMAFAADPDTEAPTVAKSFSTVTYTGTGADPLVIDGLGFKPGLVWIKTRDQAREHILSDIVRGPNKEISSNDTSAEEARGVKSFDDDGFTLDNATFNYNNNGEDYVAWAWKADDNEPTINTEGTIESLVSANANAGFSIVKYEGNGTSGATIGHGLSSTPEMIIVKNLSSLSAWPVFHTGLGATKYLALNQTSIESTASNVWNDTSPNSTTFTVGNWGPVNTNGDEHIAYCFHSVSGYSKIGSYTGNGGFKSITTGFQPDLIIFKNATGFTGSWVLQDSVRGTTKYLKANTSQNELTENPNLTFTSTGFTLNNNWTEWNRDGETILYAAFKIN